MAGLTVGGVTIPVAVSGVSRNRSDAVDRSRAFDNTYRASQTGGAARDWSFSTPPVTRALADTYEITLGTVTAQTCTGDIIAVPTLCCAEITGWTPIRVGVGHYVVIDFTLHEVQPAGVLIKYSPAVTISGESFTRSTIGYQLNSSGMPVSKAIDVKRDGHFVGGVQTTLLEGPAINNLLWASDFSNAAWGKTNMSVGTGIADPTGGTGACTLTATAGSASAEQHPANAASIVRTNSVWIKRRTGTGAIWVLKSDGSAWTTVSVTSTWTRFSPDPVAASVVRYMGVFIVTSGDAVDVWNAQQEDTSFATSEIPTTTVAVTRGGDFYSLPFTTPPQEITVYAKFVEKGTLLSQARIFSITNAADGSPEFISYGPGGVSYVTYHHDGVSAVSVGLVGPAFGVTTEIMSRLYADGSVDHTQSLNGAAATVGTQTNSNALNTSWAGPLLWLNSGGTGAATVGFTALLQFKIVSGVRTLAEMRVA